MEDPQYGMTTVYLYNLAYADEPFVLANDVAQVFYVKDMSTKPRKRKDKEANTSYDEPKRHIVLSGKRNIVEVDDKIDMLEDYEKFHEIAPFTVNIDLSIQLMMKIVHCYGTKGHTQRKSFTPKDLGCDRLNYHHFLLCFTPRRESL